MKFVNVDLTLLKRMTNNIINAEPIELKIIEFYRSDVIVNEKSTFEDFTNYVLEYMHRGVGNYTYNDLESFFNLKRYITVYTKFIVALEYLINKEIGVYYERVSYSRLINNGVELIVEFKVEE